MTSAGKQRFLISYQMLCFSGHDSIHKFTFGGKVALDSSRRETFNLPQDGGGGLDGSWRDKGQKAVSLQLTWILIAFLH